MSGDGMEYDGENDLQTELAVARLIYPDAFITKASRSKYRFVCYGGSLTGNNPRFQKHSAETCVALMEKLKLDVDYVGENWYAKQEVLTPTGKVISSHMSDGKTVNEAVYECAALIVQANNDED